MRARRQGGFVTALDAQRILDALADAVVVVDRSHRIVAASAGVERLLGWLPAELAEQPLSTLAPGYAPFEFEHSTLRRPAVRRDGTVIEMELRPARLSERATNGDELCVVTLRAASSGACARGRGCSRPKTTSVSFRPSSTRCRSA